MQDRDSSLAGTNKFLSLATEDIKTAISSNEYLGFQVLKRWEVTEGNLNGALQSSYIQRSLEDEQVISIVRIIKGLKGIQTVQGLKDLFLPTGKQATGYKVVSGEEISKANTDHPDRCLLLRDLGGGRFVVADFGDFPAYDRGQLLQYMAINKKLLDLYSDTLFYLVNEVRVWLELTGSEFIINPTLFRLRRGKSTEAKTANHQPS